MRAALGGDATRSATGIGKGWPPASRPQPILVWTGHAGEVGDVAGERFAVQALDVALGQGVDGAAHVDLDETGRLRPHLVADLAIRRDGGRDRHAATADDEPRHVADAPDVGVAVLLGEAQAFREMSSHLIAVEQLDMAAVTGEPRGQRNHDRRPAGSGESCAPDHEALAHASLPSRPQRRLTAVSSAPNTLSTLIPITKIPTTTPTTSSISASFP